MRKFKLLFTLMSLMLIGTGGLFAQPANDLCGGAITFAPGDVLTGTTTTATGTDSPGTCVTFVGPADQGIWYTISGFEGLLSATTCTAATTFDTKLTVFSGDCGALTCVTGNDDNCGPFLFRSTVNWSASADETYYVYLSGFGGATGTAEIEFSGVAIEAPSSGDLGYFIDSDGLLLQRIDLASGETSVVGALDAPTGFATGAEIVGGTLYVTDADNANQLLAIDTATAMVTPIAFVTGGSGNFISSISEDPNTGTVYMTDFVPGGGPSNLYTLDLTTGVATLVGANTGVGAIMAFSVNDDGRAFGINVSATSATVFEFDLTDFSTITANPVVDPLGNQIPFAFGQDMDFDCSEEGNILFGIFQDFNTGTRYGALDPETGVFIDIASPVNQLAQVGAFSTACAVEPVEPGAGFTVNLSAITNVNVTLDGDCEAKLTARQVLIGDFDTDDTDGEDDPAPNDLFDIVVQDSDPSNGMIIDGCGTFIWTATNNQPDSILSGFTTAWGYVNAEDKTSPQLVDSLETPAGLFCVDIAGIGISDLPSIVSRCWIQGADSGPVDLSTLSPMLAARLNAGGGIPDFFDGCSDVEICVNDLVQDNGPCDDLVITRVFTATDGISCESVSGEENDPTVYSYDIVFTAPSIDSVVGVDSTATFSCSENFPTLDANVYGDENPAPQADDFPFLLRENGMQVFLSAEGFCNLGAAFQDGPRIVTCENTYKFVRTFTVIDWCDVNNIRTFTQLVKVGDFEAPTITPPSQDRNFDGIPDPLPLFYSTNTPNCESIFVIPGGSAIDNCDMTPTVTAVIYPGGDTLAIGIGPFPVGQPVGIPIPRGEHLIRYFATDNCDNVSTLDIPVVIGDETAPVAICENGLNISIGGSVNVNGGTAELCAEDINRASYDDCSDIELRITRVDAENRPIDANGNLILPAQNAYVECITLTCAELGNVRVSLRVTDDGNEDGSFDFGIDNSNFCWLDVLVEDKTPPVCIAPTPMTFTCADLDAEFPQDLNLEVVIDPVGTFALLNAQFGEATGLDNCPDPEVTQTVTDTRNSCGVGTILRTFVVTDGQGFTSPPGCMQTITVIGVHDYTVVFPGDQENEDCVEPDYNGVTFTEFGCDLITVATSIDTFTATADECYKLRINYEVLNWCEYSTLDPAYEIPRDADNDNILINDSTVLHVIPNADGLGDDVALLDRDVNRANFNTIGALDTGNGGTEPGSDPAGYGMDGSRGAFTYHQFIKVYDNNAPTLVVTEPDSAFCSITNDCLADVELGFSITDECSPEFVNATVELDAFRDPGPDGIYTLADFVADGGNVTSAVTNNMDGTFTVNLADLPIGDHALRIRATDGCGNTVIDLLEFEIVDCKAPTPICINGLTATLMPDGDGGGMAAIWASDFIASPSFDCSGEVKFAIYRDGEQPLNPSPADTGLVLTCADEGPVMVRIYAIDPFGQADYCLTMLLVQAFAPGVCTNPDGGSLAGAVFTPNTDMMDGVGVNISNDASMNETSFTTNGIYQFTELALGEDYTLEPSYNPGVNLSTVSTADLILISRHILGLQELTGEYQLLAANVNLDNNINILDIIAIRRVILGLDAAFQATNSWRFYVAGDAGHAQVYNENNLAGNVTGIDWVAVEMGNVTDALASFSGNAESEGRATMGLNVNDIEMTAGNTYDVTFSAADLAGFQGTFELAPGIQLTDVSYAAAKAGNFNLTNAAQGLISVSYDGEAGEFFTLSIRATADAQLSNVLSVSDRLTVAEAYGANGEVANLGLNFTNAAVATTDFALLQNSPNPFADRTQIAFNLPTAANVSLTVQDVQGRVVMVRQIEGNAGYNTTTLTVGQLNGASGVLTYTLVAGDYSATRKLVVLQ